MNHYAVSIILAVIVVLAGSALTITTSAQPVQDRFTIAIDTPNARVSPGGVLRFHVKGSSNTGYDYVNIDLSVSDATVIDSFSTPYASWHSSEPTNQSRYISAFINKTITSLPRTIKINARKSGNLVASATFSIVQGSHGHRYPSTLKGKHVKELRVESDTPAWYRFLCVENTDGSGHCKLDFKQGTFYPHDIPQGHPRHVPKHSCSDEGWTAGSKLAIRSPFVYDLSRLIEKRKGSHTVPSGHTSHDSAICRIISDSPIIIEPVEVVPQHN